MSDAQRLATTNEGLRNGPVITATPTLDRFLCEARSLAGVSGAELPELCADIGEVTMSLSTTVEKWLDYPWAQTRADERKEFQKRWGSLEPSPSACASRKRKAQVVPELHTAAV